MTRTAALLLPCLLLLLGAASAQRFNLLDPSSWVEVLSQPAHDTEKWKRPDFCGNSECPPFQLEKKTDDYEIRTYESGKWAVTKVRDSKYELAYTKATARLMKYFKGGNENDTTMDLTTPTLARLKPDKDVESTKRDYSFSYWIPEEYQKDTPKPTDDDIKIKCYGKATVYVHSFGGFATESTILSNARSLHEVLKDDDRDFSTREVFAAVYDPPQKLLNRYNEIHVVVGGKELSEVAHT